MHTQCLYAPAFLRRLCLPLLLLASLIPAAVEGQIVCTFTANDSFVIPPTVTSIQVETWGAGGRGGTRSNDSGRSGGGGGGAYSRTPNVPVTPGATYYIGVGVGSTNPGPGGDSWFNASNTPAMALVMAKGGNSAGNNTTAGASGGAQGSGIGNTRYSGGNGANGTNGGGGGGGSSAGTAANGTDGAVLTGGIAPAGGGNGGNGVNVEGPGAAGSVPGGGGGGCRRQSGTRLGGAGANGQVRLTYSLAGGVPTKVTFLSLAPNQPVFEGGLIPVTVELRGANDQIAASVGNTVVNLSSNLLGTFRNAANNADITFVTIPANEWSATFFYRPWVAGDHEITGTSAPLTSSALEMTATGFPRPAQFFYLPVPEAQMLTVLQTIAGSTTPTNPVQNYVSIAVVSNGTIIYYDQMENGYEADIGNPSSIFGPGNPSGTQIWGDGNPDNGAPPGIPGDLLNTGTVIRLLNGINSALPPDPATPFFRGSDKIAASRPIAVTVAGWASASATLLAGSNEVYDTFSWGTDHRVPVGENIPDAIDNTMFSYTGAAIMAGRGGATVQIDADANGVFETAVNLSEGQSHLINGGLSVGARFLSNNPVQVDLFTGDRGDNYESRFKRLLPINLWANQYYSPVSTPEAVQGFNGVATTVWLYNPGNSAISVTYDRRGSVGLSSNVANMDSTFTSGVLPGSSPGNVYGPIVELNNNGTLAWTPEGAWIGIVNRSGSNDPTIASKVVNAQAAGAAAVIIVNNTGGNALPTETSGTPSIPVVGISQNTGAALRALGLGSGWVRVSGAPATSNINVPAGSYARQVVTDGYGSRFTASSPFYALSATNSTGIDTTNTVGGANRTWDWGYTLVPSTSLTSQVLVGLGSGKDPTTVTNANENGSPVWVTTTGNGDTDTLVYVDFDADPGTGPFTDPLGNRYDLLLTMRELEMVKVYNPEGDQTSMLLYSLDSNVKLAAAWGQDPLQASAGQPGLDMGTGIPPLPQFLANKDSKFVNDNDSDGYLSPGDGIEYEISVFNTSRVPLADVLIRDLLPATLEYVPGSTTFTDELGVTNPIPDDGSGTPFPLDGAGVLLPDLLPPYETWTIRFLANVVPFAELPPGTTQIINVAVVNSLVINEPVTLEVEDPLFGRIGDFVWIDANGNGFQDGGEIGFAGVTVNLLDGNGNPVLDLMGFPITTITGPNGEYIFTGLPPGTYSVEFKLPTGYVFTAQDADGQGLNGLFNSDADPITGTTGTFVLAAGEANTNVDAGLLLPKCPDRWAAWQDRWEPEIGNTNVGLTDNPDGDRYSNLIEYAFCLPPNSGVGKPFCLTPGANGVAGVFSRTADAPKDLQYFLQWSATLASPTSWSAGLLLDNSNTVVVVNHDGTETVTIPNLEGLTGLSDTGFVRIRADLKDGATTIATDHTDVLGWKTTDLGLCCGTYNYPLLKCVPFTGTITSVDGQTITFGNSPGANLAPLLDPAFSYYIEVESGDLEGHRFDVVAALNNTLTLANDGNLCSKNAPFNTLTGPAPPLLQDDRIALRIHRTLDEVFPPAGFAAGPDDANADRVQVYSGGMWTIYWLFENAGNPIWVDADGQGGPTDMGNTVIPPGQGMFFNNVTSAKSLLAFGEVRENDFKRPLCAGSNLVGGGYPVDQSATGTLGRRMDLRTTTVPAADGFFGSRDFKTADSFFIWTGDANPGLTSYDTYYLLSGAPINSIVRWVKVGDATLTPRGGESLFLMSRAAFIRAAAAIPGYGYAAPWTPNP